MVYGIDVVPVYISPMIVAYGSSKIASYSKEMSQSLYVAEISPVYKITFSEKFNSSLTIKSSLRPYGYTGWLKKSNLTVLQTIYETSFIWHFPALSLSVLHHLIFSQTLAPSNHWPTVCLEVAFIHVLFHLRKGPCIYHKYESY